MPPTSDQVYQSIDDRNRHVEQTGTIYPAGEYAEIVAAEEVPAPDDVADALGVEPGSPVIRRHRVTRRADGTARSSSTSWFPGDVAQVAPQLLVRERIRQGTGRYLQECTGQARADSGHSVSARLATDDEAAELEIATPAAVLESQYVARDGAGRVLTYEVGLGLAGHRLVIR